MRERDWDGALATMAPTFQVDDRRRLMRMQLSYEEHLAHMRLLFDTRWTRLESVLLATRGERLALFREHFHGNARVPDGRGRADPVEFASECISLLEIGADGRQIAGVAFDPGDLDAAYAELSARYAAGEGAPYAALLANLEAMATLDAAGFERLVPDDFTMTVHRRFAGTGLPMSRDEFIAWLRVTTDDLGAHQTLRANHLLRLSPRTLLAVGAISGTVDGGDFETVLVNVVAHDGTIPHAIEAYDLDQLDVATARYEELTAVTPRPVRIENAATHAVHRVVDAWVAHDWERFAALLPATYRNIDRQRMAQLEIDRDRALHGLRELFELTTSVTAVALATRGSPLALFRIRWNGSGSSVGPSEHEWLDVFDVDRHERVTFDSDDLDAAYTELDRRYVAGEAAPHAHTVEAAQRLLRGVSARDWAQWTSALTEDFVLEDHRPLGWGTRSRDELLTQTRAMVELASDAVLRGDHVLAIDHRRMLCVGRWVGTREGGAFEIPMVYVFAHSRDGRIRRADVYGEDRLDAARARYDALATEAPVPRIENAATRSKDRFLAAWHARDWDGVAAVYAPGFRLSDRRAMVRLELEPMQALDSIRMMFSSLRSTWEVKVLATRGERLMLARVRWEGRGGGGGPSEVDVLEIVEVNDRETRELQIVLDPGDLDAAWDELDARYAAGEAAAHGRRRPTAGDLKRAFAARDWDALAAVGTPDFVLVDHRPMGWGTLDRTAYIEALKALAALAPDTTFRTDHVWTSRHGALSIMMIGGTHEGGAFEEPRVTVSEHDGRGAYRRIDWYGLAQLDEARARFAALRPDPLRIPPNAASRVRDRMRRTAALGDWSAFRALAQADFTFDDRTRRSLVTGDLELFLENAVFLASQPRAKLTPELIGTAGDRIALEHQVATGGPDGGEFENEYLSLTEVDADGRLVTMIYWDVDDRAAAFVEARARFLAGEAAGVAAQARLMSFDRAALRRDWEATRECFADDLRFRDHRVLGLGLADRDGLIELVRVIADLAPDRWLEWRRILTWNDRGIVALIREGGTVPGGGPFENVFVGLAVTDGDRIRHFELFDVDDADSAVAHFEELCANPD